MKIGTVEIPGKVALAPMAGVTDLAYRTICRELGCGYTVTEMISAKALCYQDKKTRRIMELGPEEHPGAIQLFGSDVVCMEEAAAKIMELERPDVIDINMGCPAPKIAGNHCGSALMREPDLCRRIVQAGTKAVSTRWSSARCSRAPERRRSPSTAGPKPRCTPARRTGTSSGR